MSVHRTLVVGAVALLAFCLPLTAAGSPSHVSALAAAQFTLATTTASGTASPTGSPGAVTTATIEPTATVTLTSAEAAATAGAQATATAGAATATAAATPNPDTLQCLSVGGSTCPLVSTVTVTVNAPGTLTVTGTHWPYSPAQPASNVVRVYLVSDPQPCGPVPGDAIQAQIDSLGTFTAAVPLPADARDGDRYGLCASSADGQVAFPAGSPSTTSLLYIRITRTVEVAPLDLFSLLAIGLAALAVLLYLFRPRRASGAS